MRKLFFDLDQDDREYWANYVTNSGYQVADNQSFYSPSSNDNSFVSNSPSNNPSNQPTVGLAPNKGATNVQSNNSSSSSNSKGVTCYNCVNGVVEGRSYQNLSVCPQGETTDPNPCMTSCTTCNGGSPMMNMFQNECPDGWMPEFDFGGKTVDPCADVDCWDCTTGGKQRVTSGTPCASETAIRVAVHPTNNSSLNPCSPDLGPETDCWNCTTGVVTRTPSESECQGNNGDAIYRVNILANGSSDNPCKKFSNYCYKCTDGVVESEVFQSDIEAECPTDWTQDKKPCYIKSEPTEPEPEPKKEIEIVEPAQAGFLAGNTKYITFGVALLAVLMLIKKPSNS